MLMNTGRRRRRRRNNNRQHKQPTADGNPTTPAGIHGERDRLGIQWVNVVAAVFLVLGCSTKKNRGGFDALFPRRGECRWGHLKKSLRENNLAWVRKDLSEPSRTVSWLAPFPYPPPADAPWSISNDLQRPLAGIVSCDTKTGPLGASFLPGPFFLFRGHIRQITLRGQREYSFRLYVRNFAVQCSLLVREIFLGGWR